MNAQTGETLRSLWAEIQSWNSSVIRDAVELEKAEQRLRESKAQLYAAELALDRFVCSTIRGLTNDAQKHDWKEKENDTP